MKKIYIKVLIGFIITFVLSIMGLNLLLERKIAQKLNKIDNYSIENESIDVSLLQRSITIKKLQVKDSLNNNIKIGTLKASDIQLLSLIFSDSYDIGNLTIEDCDAVLYKNDKSHQTEDEKKNQKKVTIKNIAFKKATIHYKDVSEKNIVSVENVNGKLKNVQIDPENSEKKFSYENIYLEATNVLLPINNYQNFSVEKLLVNNETIKSATVKITTIYNKVELQQHLKKEKDWISLQIDSLNIYNFSIKKESEKVTYASPKIDIINGNLEAYRDKSLPDDTQYKPLYSKVLRNLPFHLNITEITIKKSSIKYSEKVNKTPGSIVFTDISGSIKNINTKKGNGETLIEVKSKFMDDAIFKLFWKFDINNNADFFTLYAEMEHLNASKINQFLEPNMNILTSGNITNLTFDINANENNATGTFQLKYSDFRIKIKSNDLVTKFVSSIANIFVNSNKQNDKKVTIKVERNKQKSFFNYLWLCVKKGIIKTAI